MFRWTGLLALLLAGVIALSASAAATSRHMLVGIFDPAQVYSSPEKAFPTLKDLRVQIVRVQLEWGRIVARKKPKNATDPGDPAYNWSTYDRIVQQADKYKIRVLFNIYGTPKWESGSVSANRAPKNMNDLRDFAYAAARRYSGTFKPTKDAQKPLPAVRYWLAWNEPNNPVFLWPQYRLSGRRWIPLSAINYAQMCASVYTGVHKTGLSGQLVACGGTDPHGNNNPRSSRASISPVAFLIGLKHYGLKSFDAYAHHPYYSYPRETPATPPAKTDKTSVTLGNINILLSTLTKYYGSKPLWITEYGYQTNPPDRYFGVSYSNQSKYMAQAYAIARRNPRIAMMLWFLLRDESRVSGWQSGVISSSGKKKPAYDTFKHLPH